jgi:hypothetical protein
MCRKAPGGPSAIGRRFAAAGTAGRTIGTSSQGQFPLKQPIRLAWHAPIGLPLAGPSLDRYRILRRRDQAIPIKQPGEPGLIDLGKRSLPLSAEQVTRPPAQVCGDGTERTIKKEADVVDERLPAAQRHVAGRAIGIEPSERLSPVAWDAAFEFDDCRALLLKIAPFCREPWAAGGAPSPATRSGLDSWAGLITSGIATVVFGTRGERPLGRDTLNSGAASISTGPSRAVMFCDTQATAGTPKSQRISSARTGSWRRRDPFWIRCSTKPPVADPAGSPGSPAWSSSSAGSSSTTSPRCSVSQSRGSICAGS